VQKRVAVALWHRVKLGAADDGRLGFDDADFSRDRGGGQGVVAGDDDDPDARAAAARDGVCYIGPRRVLERRRPDERQLRLDQCALPVLDVCDVTLGEPEHAQASGGVALKRRPHLRSVGVRQWMLTVLRPDRRTALE